VLGWKGLEAGVMGIETRVGDWDGVLGRRLEAGKGIGESEWQERATERAELLVV